MRAIDVWVVLCYIGVFSALVEYCIILYLSKSSILEQKLSSKKLKQYDSVNQDDQSEIHKDSNGPEEQESEASGVPELTAQAPMWACKMDKVPEPQIKQITNKQCEKKLKYARKIENISRVIIVTYNVTFPFCYFFICITFS